MSDLIFISHASGDKTFVSGVISRIPKSHLFYDVDTINPGSHTTDALDDGLLSASVFAMFVSPNTTKSIWVQYESGVAYVQKIRRNHINIVAIPILGATYKDAPEWMQQYMAIPPGYSQSDIARLLKYLYEESLRNQGELSTPLFVGREALCNEFIVETRTRSVETGVPINFVVVSGIQNMGRFCVAKHVAPQLYPGCRKDFPVFELPRYADAADLFLALRQDISGESGMTWSQTQLSAFPADPAEQASVLMANLGHFAKINQVVIVRSAFGLRNQMRDLKGWIKELFEAMKKEPNVRLIWISERLLAPETILHMENVIQLRIPELKETEIVYLLTELLDITTSSPAALKRVAPYINGHPGSAHYVASLIKNSQRAPESLIEKPEAIRVFQEECVREAIAVESIGILGRDVIALLRLLPWAEYETITAVLDDFATENISETLWMLTDNCVVNYSMSAGYQLAEIVRSVAVDKATDLSSDRLDKLARLLTEKLQHGHSNHHAVESLIFVFVRLKGNIPEEFKTAITGATLLDIVEQYYRLGHKIAGNWQENFRTAARLALLAADIPMSIDTLETILFNGAESLIRIGEDPSSIISAMQKKRLPSVSYILGSYYYFSKHDPDLAIPYLDKALQDKSYIKRTGRLLAKIYMEKGMPRAGLQVLEKLGENRVNRDTGLLVQKIRCLRACGMQAEANKLVGAMRSLDDEYGEYELLVAARQMKQGNYNEALDSISRAKLKAKVNRFNLRLLETAVQIEKGDTSNLEETCKLAQAIGLDSGMHSLRARAHITAGEWRPAELDLAKLTNKNYYDKLLVMRMLELKKQDLEVIADPINHRSVKQSYESILVELRRDGDGEWAYGGP